MRTHKKVFILLTALTLSGCGKAAYNFSSSNPDDFSTQPGYPDDDVVCDPSSLPPSANHGIVGQLHYLTPTQVQTGLGAKLSDYFNQGIHVATSVFMNKLNIPTQEFTKGFITNSGLPLKTVDGDVLTEWFALKYDMRVKLADDEPTGKYQFALLADDGVILSMPARTLISNDTVTGTSFNVAQDYVSMGRQTKLPLELKYFQGPRMHISLVLMWRPWNGDADDPEDGQAGNDRYFDFTTTPSTPKQPYLDMLARGWKPLRPENFLLPENQVNPCY